MGSSPTVPTMIEKLRTLYEPPEWAFFTEVRSGTGSGVDDLRILDGLAVNTWPSGKGEIRGFEQKVRRDDWRREKKQPHKSKLARFCTRFYLVVPAPRKLVIPDLQELPKGWGLIEIGTGKPVEIVEAEKRQAIEPDYAFTLSLIRAASTQGVALVGDLGSAPLKAITRPDLSRSHVGLSCGHAAPKPLEKKMPAKVHCFACADGEPTDIEVAEAIIADATDEQIESLSRVIERQRMIRNLRAEVA